MLKIPSEVKIGGHIYKVILCDREDMDNDAGQHTLARNVIKIRKDLPRSQIEETYIHEVLHSINGDFSEEKIEFLSMAIYAFLRDNKYIK